MPFFWYSKQLLAPHYSPEISMLINRQSPVLFPRLPPLPKLLCMRQAREANRYLLSLLEKPLENGREFSVVRGQEDTELYRYAAAVYHDAALSPPPKKEHVLTLLVWPNGKKEIWF